MNKIKYYFLLLLALPLFSCKGERAVYDETTNRLSFEFDRYIDSISRHTFFYDPVDATEKLFEIQINTMGFVTDYDRSFELEQIIVEGALNAEPGVDYMAFDHPDMKKAMVIKAGENKIMLPIRLYRSDRVSKEFVELRMRIKENSEFSQGLINNREKSIIFSGRLSRPKKWDKSAETYFFGTYGEMKHAFMIEATGEKWDDEYVNVVMDDYNFLMYWKSRLYNLLAEENERRVKNGLEPLREDDPVLGVGKGEIIAFPR